MSGVGACLALFVLAFQSEQTAATFWETAALPSDPNDPYYKSKLTYYRNISTMLAKHKILSPHFYIHLGKYFYVKISK